MTDAEKYDLLKKHQKIADARAKAEGKREGYVTVIFRLPGPYQEMEGVLCRDGQILSLERNRASVIYLEGYKSRNLDIPLENILAIQATKEDGGDWNSVGRRPNGDYEYRGIGIKLEDE